MIEIKNGLLKMEGTGEDLFNEIGAIVKNFKLTVARNHTDEEVKAVTNELIGFIAYELMDDDEKVEAIEKMKLMKERRTKEC